MEVKYDGLARSSRANDAARSRCDCQTMVAAEVQDGGWGGGGAGVAGCVTCLVVHREQCWGDVGPSKATKSTKRNKSPSLKASTYKLRPAVLRFAKISEFRGIA